MIKQQLKELYTNNHHRFITASDSLKEYNPHGPYLSSPSEAYLQQQNPLLIIGQETHFWENHTDITKQMGVYSNFNVGINYPSTPFWNVTRKIETALGHIPYSCAALNLNKFDIGGGKPKKEAHIEPIRRLDDILVSEINIINPKLCIFFTSHNSDYRLHKIYPGLEIIPVDGWNVNQLSLLRHEHLPQYSFRTYHPSYLRRTGLESTFVKHIKELGKSFSSI